MVNKDDVVAPPRRDDVVAPPQRPSDVVAPPQRPSDVVAPPQRPSDVVAPPQRPSDVVAPPQRPGNVVAPQNTGNTGQNQADDQKYKTPKVGPWFYMSGYLFWSLIIFVIFGTYGDFTKVLLTIYIVASNYTYCWFADYQRYKGGPGAQLFAKNFSASASASIAGGMNHTTGSVKKTWTGGYKVSSRRSISETIITFFITYMTMELLRLLINIPIAFYSLFTHKKTVRKYYDLVEARGDY